MIEVEVDGSSLRFLADRDLLDALDRTTAAVTAAELERLRLIAEIDRRSLHIDEGHVSTGALLHNGTWTTRAEAHALVRTAHHLDRYTIVADAVADGTLSLAKARALFSAVNERTAAAFADQQAFLVERVANLWVEGTRTVAGVWARYADADGAEPHDDPADIPSTLRVRGPFDDRTLIQGELNAEDAAILRTTLERLAEEIYRAECATAGDDEVADHMPADQRHAAALVEMARRATAADPNRSPARPLLEVTVPLDVLEARTDQPGISYDGGSITADTVRRLACGSDWIRILMSPESAILDYGRTARTAPADLMRAIRARDRGCTWPRCSAPVGHCDAHHIRWWKRDLGETNLENMTLLCSHHHKVAHRKGWSLRRRSDGSIEVTRPDGRVLHAGPPHGPTPFPGSGPTWLDRVEGHLRLKPMQLTPTG